MLLMSQLQDKAKFK